MARGFRKFDTIEHKSTGIKVDLRVSTSEGTFYAQTNGRKFENKNLATIKREVVEYLDESMKFNWLPVIKIAVGERSDYYSSKVIVNLKYDRFYYSPIGDEGDVVKVEWDCEESRRTHMFKPFHNWGDGDTFALPLIINSEKQTFRSYNHSDTTTFYLPYDSAMWEALERMSRALNTINVYLPRGFEGSVTATANQITNALLDVFPERLRAAVEHANEDDGNEDE